MLFWQVATTLAVFSLMTGLHNELVEMNLREVMLPGKKCA